MTAPHPTATPRPARAGSLSAWAIALLLAGGLAQTAAAQSAAATIDTLLAAIERQESRSDGYAPQLGELYFSLGRAFADQQAHAEALDAYQTAMQIERINQGLNAISQTPYLFAVADSHQQLGERERATDALYALYNLAISHYGEESEELIPTLDRLLDWQLRAYHLSEPKPGFKHLVDADKIAAHQLSLLIAKTEDSDIAADMPSYQRAIEVNYTVAEHILQYGLPTDNGFSISAGIAVERTPATHTQSSYRNGKMALEQIILRIERSAATDRAKLAEAVAMLGDWYLAFGQQDSAEEAYKLAYQVTQPTSDSPEAPDTEIADQPPSQQPTVLGEQLFATPRAILFTRQSTTWPNQSVSASVDKKGRLTAIEWPQRDTPFTEQELNRVRKLANQVRYRPRIDPTGSRDSAGPVELAINPELAELFAPPSSPAVPPPSKEQPDAEDTSVNAS